MDPNATLAALRTHTHLFPGGLESCQHDGIVTISNSRFVTSIMLETVTELGAVLRLMNWDRANPVKVFYIAARPGSRGDTGAYMDRTRALASIAEPEPREVDESRLSYNEMWLLIDLLFRFEINHTILSDPLSVSFWQAGNIVRAACGAPLRTERL